MKTRAGLAAILCLIAVSWATELPSYHLVPIGRPEQDTAYISTAINNVNQVAGYCYLHVLTEPENMEIRGFILTGRKITILPPLPGFNTCKVFGMNDSGDMVGLSYHDSLFNASNPEVKATLWRDSAPVDISIPGIYRSAAWDINNAGTIVGWYGVLEGGAYSERLVRYHRDRPQYPEECPIPSSFAKRDFNPFETSVVSIHRSNMLPKLLASAWTVVTIAQINNIGAIACGFASNQGNNFTLLWDGIAVRDMLTATYRVAGYMMVPTDLNDSMSVVGTFMYCSSGWPIDAYPFLWRADSVSILPHNATTGYYAWSINNDGVVAGYTGGTAAARRTALLWHGDSIRDIDSLVADIDGWHVYDAAINNTGVLSGAAVKDSCIQSVLLVPIKQVVMPIKGTVTVTLLQASASLVSDVYLTAPQREVLIEDNLKNVGVTVQTVFDVGTPLEFGITVHGSSGDYEHLSTSHYARTERVNDTLWTVHFEDLPDSLADWDYNDVVLKVEINGLTSGTAAVGARPIPGSWSVSCVNGSIRVRTAGKIDEVTVLDLAGRVMLRVDVTPNGFIPGSEFLPVGPCVVRARAGAEWVCRRIVKM